jgi:hypothetical protein
MTQYPPGDLQPARHARAHAARDRALTAALAGALRRAGLPDPEITLHVVAAIARRPDTGKTRRFIPSRDDAGVQGEEG